MSLFCKKNASLRFIESWKGIILFEAIGPFHVNFHHDVPSNTNFFSSSPKYETVSQQENRPLSFRYEVFFR